MNTINNQPAVQECQTSPFECATALYLTERFILKSASPGMMQIWGNDSQKVGESFMTLPPELNYEFYLSILKKVFATGVSYQENERKVSLQKTDTGNTGISYFNVSYQAHRNTQNEIEGVVIYAFDVTPYVHAASKAEDKETDLFLCRLESEQYRTDAKLARSRNIDLQAELSLSKLRIDDLSRSLLESETRFLTSVEEAPIAVCILNGEDLMIECANAMMMFIFARTSAVLLTPFSTAFPELYNPGLIERIQATRTSGKNTYGTEIQCIINKNGLPNKHYFNLIFKPKFDKSGNVSAVILIAIDVTEQINNKNELQRAMDLLKISAGAANIGTWSMDLYTGKVLISARHKELFGFTGDKDVDASALMERIPEEQRIEVFKAVDTALSTGGLFDITYSAIGFEDNQLRWIRALGDVTKDESGIPIFFSGITVETTRQKRDESRKNEFINIVSHELKTPLTSLKGYIQLLQLTSEEKGDDYMSTMLIKADKRLDKMTSLINGFLNVSQLESGKIQLRMEVFDINILINEIIDEFQLNSSGTNIVFTPSPQTFMEADRDRIGQVITNLLSNAEKYSPLKTPISISCETKNQLCTVTVTDQGAGISKDDLKFIFERYYRVQNTQNQSILGFGIGLYFCHEILLIHSTSLDVKSDLGKGSEFSFSLPAACITPKNSISF